MTEINFLAFFLLGRREKIRKYHIECVCMCLVSFRFRLRPGLIGPAKKGTVPEMHAPHRFNNLKSIFLVYANRMAFESIDVAGRAHCLSRQVENSKDFSFANLDHFSFTSFGDTHILCSIVYCVNRISPSLKHTEIIIGGPQPQAIWLLQFHGNCSSIDVDTEIIKYGNLWRSLIIMK